MTTTSLAVMIGRFHGAHAGHLKAMRAALDSNDRLLVLIGGANRSRSWKRPFTAEERQAFLIDALGPLADRVDVRFLPDKLYDDPYWCRAVRAAVASLTNTLGDTVVTLVGFPKDRTSDYLNWFPEWNAAPSALTLSPKGVMLNATDARRALFLGIGDVADFGADAMAPIQAWIAANPATAAWITEEGAAVERTLAALARAKAGYGYEVAVPTVDAVVVREGCVLMAKRGRAPGKGLWALPGGHIDPFERSTVAVVRELLEETGLTAVASQAFFRGIYDHPDRSDRGWLRTEAFAFDWTPAMGEATGAQDAGEVSALAWIPIHTLDSRHCFEDHAEIVAEIAATRPALALVA